MPLNSQIERLQANSAGFPAWLLVPAIIILAGCVHWLVAYGPLVGVINVLISLTSSLAVLWAWYRRSLFQPCAWWLIGLSGLAGTIGHALWYSGDLGDLSALTDLALLFYLTNYGVLIGGLWQLGRQVETREGALIDALMLAVAAAAVLWAVMLEPALTSGAGSLELLFAAVYPVIDLILLLFTLKLLFLAVVRTVALYLLISAAGLLLLADVTHALGVHQGWYVRGGSLDLLWYGVYALLAAAAWHPSATAEPVHSMEAGEQSFLRLVVVGLLAVSIPGLLMLTAGPQTYLVQVGGLAVIVLFVLLLIRSTLLVRRVQDQSKALRHLVRTDPLTGAANRRGLREKLQAELARAARREGHLVLVYLDLDYFKRFNDAHGHEAGDIMLQSCVTAWQKVLRAPDLLARTGGEEFVLVCPDTDVTEARTLLARLREVTPSPQTFSAGLSAYEQGDSSDSMLRRADNALYEAKKQGRDRVLVG